jgi:DNA invertase Pin-like site-specific DNA recombinase
MQYQVRAKEKKAASGLRAAQYLRVSTDQQKYTMENQAAAVAAYAARRNIMIVSTYSDRRSGVRIAGREGLQQLIRDVQRGGTGFNCILVYDVSRWGRFPDVDESGYYEFICRRAGINIHYCADDFENDGSFASIIVKTNKRVAAADFSQQLSKKVFLGQCRVTTLGHWRGGPAPYGLRRMLVSENGKPKRLLKFGQQKSLKLEHVVLVPGPASEIKVVRQVFNSFANQRKTRTEIADNLNAKRIKNARGNPWSMLTISNTLRNEVYLGDIIYNRRSQKLGERQVRNPKDMWIRCNNAFRPIISRALFAKAQQVMADLDRGKERTDKELIDVLAALRRKHGRLSLKLMLAAKNVPHPSLYTRRFGSVTAAYRRAGFKPRKRYCFDEIAADIDEMIRTVAAELITALEKRRADVVFMPELYLLTINRSLSVAMSVARSVANGIGTVRSRRWELRKLRYRRADLTLVIRMDNSNSQIQNFYLIPTINIPKGANPRTRISERNFGEYECDNINEVLSMLSARLCLPRIGPRTPFTRAS